MPAGSAGWTARLWRRTRPANWRGCGPASPTCTWPSRDLSGGQRQALAIARAAAWTSKVLLLDEPTSALGVEQQQQVLDLIRRVRDEGIAVLLVSHQMPDVLAVCDRAVALRLGSSHVAP